MTPLRIALGGLATLAVAMGIGRFAFTPILPMMLRDGTLDLARASWLASANYLGYLAGAVLCTVEPFLRARRRRPKPDSPGADERRAARVVRIGLAATVLLTAGMALPAPETWAVLRFAAGAASAYVLVHASGWCAARLAERGTPDLGGVMFAGPGGGIVATGLIASAMVAFGWTADLAWAAFAVFAIVLTLFAWPVFAAPATTPPNALPASTEGLPPAAIALDASPPDGRPAMARRSAAEVAVLSVAYGIEGFGYIVTATFLPVIARAAIAGSPLLDLFWPIFGGGVVLGALATSQWRTALDRRRLLALSYVLQAAGIGLGVVWPSEAGFALGSLLLGLPFTAVTFYALQEVRRIRPHAVPATMGLVTTLFALGQAAGPPMVAALLAASGGDAHVAFQRALAVAAASLVLGAAMFLASALRWPEGGASPTRPSTPGRRG
jgi:MFS family permease